MRLACTSSITARQFVLNTPAAIFFTFIRGLQYDHSHYTMVMNCRQPGRLSPRGPLVSL
jgi:hypothetical protein